ncbi:MAG: type II secretion system F family protein [Steroidobacteraceae bacterium]
MNAPADSRIVLLAVAMGSAIGYIAWSMAAAVLAGRRDRARPLSGLPIWLRLSLPCAAALARACEPCLRREWMDVTGRRLRRADLDEAIQPQEWLVLPLLLGATAIGLVLLAGGGRFSLSLAGLCGLTWPALWLRDRRRKIEREIDRELPKFLELLTLAVEAGCALGAALRIGVEAASAGVLQRGLAEALRAIHAGRPRGEALTELAGRYAHPGLQTMLAAIVHADVSGAGVATTLRAQTVQRTEERFARAERLAMESPVKMLAPLILCIFPCAFLVIGFPIAHRLLQWDMP